MRPIPIILSLLFLCAPPSFAQTPPPQSGDQLDEVLRGWEKSLANLQSLSMDCERTTKDKVFQTTEKHKGTAKFIKAKAPNPETRASLEMYKEVQGKWQLVEKYLFTHGALYEFAPADKLIRKHAIAQPKPGKRDDNILSFLFDKNLADALKRYQLNFVPSKDKFLYVKVQPKLEQDKAEFTEAWIALYPSNLLTAMIHFRQPNGNEVTWQFRNLKVNAPLAENEFAVPEPPPPGWQLQRVPDLRTKGP